MGKLLTLFLLPTSSCFVTFATQASILAPSGPTNLRCVLLCVFYITQAVATQASYYRILPHRLTLFIFFIAKLTAVRYLNPGPPSGQLFISIYQEVPLRAIAH